MLVPWKFFYSFLFSVLFLGGGVYFVGGRGFCWFGAGFAFFPRVMGVLRAPNLCFGLAVDLVV